MSLKKEELEKILRDYQDGKFDTLLLEEETSSKIEPICWQRALAQLPRLEINCRANNYLVPWFQIGSIESNVSYTNIKIVCDLGLFEIDSVHPLKDLYKFLQIERVKKINQTKEVRISFIEQK